MNLSTKTLLGFAIVISLSAIDSYINSSLSKKVNINTGFLTTSESIIRNSTQIHKKIIEMQSAFRGFLLTEDEDFLDSYYSGLVDISPLIKEEYALLKNPVQRIKLDSISEFHKQWVKYSEKLINAKKQDITSHVKNEAYSTLFENRLRKQVGKKLNDQISALFRDFDAFEYKIRAQRRTALTQSIEQTHLISLSFIFITIIIGLITTIYVLRSISGRISYMTAIAQNIAQGRFFPVIDGKNDELASLSSSLRVMSENLKRTINELERRNTELDQFATVVSHDLKAPLRGIHNVISWIREDMGDDLQEPLKKYTNIMHERIQRMEDLINGLLDYARVRRDKLEKEVVDVQQLTEEIIDSIVPANFNAKAINLPVLVIEKTLLEQVLSNLISNAVQYSKDDHGEIFITHQELAKVHVFTVRDNGIGIDPKFHQKIFIIFQTLRDKVTRESTGMGLSIVKKILDEQNGTIRVKSYLGGGASFVFTWPK